MLFLAMVSKALTAKACTQAGSAAGAKCAEGSGGRPDMAQAGAACLSSRSSQILGEVLFPR